MIRTNKTILVDFDNTLIVNQYDVDLTGDLDLFFKTWEDLETKPVSEQLIRMLSDKPFILFTNRGAETREKVSLQLDELGLLQNLNGMVFCAGKKLAYLSRMAELNIRDSYYLVDNAEKYNPDLLVKGNMLIHRSVI